MKMVTLNDIAEAIEDGRRDNMSSLAIAKVVEKLVNDEWYDTRKDTMEDIIEDIFGMTDEEWKVYHRAIKLTRSVEIAENVVRGEREVYDEML